MLWWGWNQLLTPSANFTFTWTIFFLFFSSFSLSLRIFSFLRAFRSLKCRATATRLFDPPNPTFQAWPFQTRKPEQRHQQRLNLSWPCPFRSISANQTFAMTSNCCCFSFSFSFSLCGFFFAVISFSFFLLHICRCKIEDPFFFFNKR